MSPRIQRPLITRRASFTNVFRSALSVGGGGTGGGQRDGDAGAAGARSGWADGPRMGPARSLAGGPETERGSGGVRGMRRVGSLGALDHDQESVDMVSMAGIGGA